jgi:hypothetical protein
VVNPRYFRGLSVEQCAEMLHVGSSTVLRDWAWRSKSSNAS